MSTVTRIDNLKKMAGQIALNLGAGHDPRAASRTADHIKRFWTPAMRGQLQQFLREGGEVEPVVAAALALLDETDLNDNPTA